MPILPQPYSHDDFVRNPGKYLLFRSARIAEPIPSAPHLSVGDFVNILYYTTSFNKGRGNQSSPYNVDMPVYKVWRTPKGGEKVREEPVFLFACALDEFLL